MKTTETLNQIISRKEEYLNNTALLSEFSVIEGEYYALTVDYRNVGCFITKKNFDNDFINNADGVSYTLEKCIYKDLALALKENIINKDMEDFVSHEFSIVKFSKVQLLLLKRLLHNLIGLKKDILYVSIQTRVM